MECVLIRFSLARLATSRSDENPFCYDRMPLLSDLPAASFCLVPFWEARYKKIINSKQTLFVIRSKKNLIIHNTLYSKGSLYISAYILQQEDTGIVQN